MKTKPKIKLVRWSNARGHYIPTNEYLRLIGRIK